MTMIAQDSGCKVGWEWYDNEPEALEASARARVNAESKAQRGYDFGYCVPGEITHFTDHHEHGECWKVTTP